MNLYEIEHLTVAEAAQLAGIGKTRFYELLQTGEVAAVKLGRRTLVKVDSLRSFLADLPQFEGQSQ